MRNLWIMRLQQGSVGFVVLFFVLLDQFTGEGSQVDLYIGGDGGTMNG